MKKLPILTGPRLAMLGCVALAVVIAPPLFMRDFRVDFVVPRPPLPDRLRAEPDTGSELVKNPRLVETPVPYLEYLADNRAASRATGLVLDEELLAGATTQFLNDSSVFDGGGMPAYEGNGGSAPVAARGSAGRSGISGFGGLPGFFGTPSRGSGNQPALVTAADLAARNGLKKTADLTREESLGGEGANEVLGDAVLGIPRSGLVYSNTPAGPDTPSGWKSTDPTVHRRLPGGGGGAAPPSSPNVGNARNGGSAPVTAGAPAGRPGISGVGGLPGVVAMPSGVSRNQPASVTTADLAASNGLENTADLTHEESLRGEGANEALRDASLEILLEILQSGVVYSNTPAGWDTPSGWSADPSGHRSLPGGGGGAPPPSIANIGNHDDPLVPVSLVHDIIGQPLPAVEQIVAASVSGADVIKLADHPSPTLAIAPAQVLPIPEPSTIALFGLGLAFLGVLTLRRRRQR